VLEEVVEWDRLGYCLEIPSLIRSEIKKKYSNDTRCKRAMLEEWRSHHPAPSWMLVANALYGRFMSGNSGKYHKLLHLVKEKYLKAPEPLLEQSASSIDTPLIPSSRPRMESAPEPLLEQSANSIDTPLIPSARPRMESAPEPLPEQSVSLIDTPFIPSAHPRMESATLQKETVSSTPTPTPPASVPDDVDAGMGHVLHIYVYIYNICMQFWEAFHEYSLYSANYESVSLELLYVVLGKAIGL